MIKTINIPVFSEKGKKISGFDLDLDEKKNFDINGTAYQVINSYMASQRAGTHDTKTRGEVSGGGQKPWRQKGTGRARAGSTRAPHWTGGGVVFGPHPRDYSFSVPKKMKKILLTQIILAKNESGKLKVFKDTGIKQGKTSEAIAFVNNMKIGKKATIVLNNENAELELRAFRNLKNIRQVTAAELNTYDIYWGDDLLLHENAVEQVKARLS